MTKQRQCETADCSILTQRTLMDKQQQQQQQKAMYGNAPSGSSQFDDSSSISSYSCSFENDSLSLAGSSNALMKAAYTLTAKRTYPRRSAPTIATGRRNLKSEPVPREEAERRRVRRERNKQAATRCRQKRNEITSMLQRTVEQLEVEKRRDEEQLRALETMRNHLQFVLNAHESVCEQQQQQQQQQQRAHALSHMAPQQIAAATLQTPNAFAPFQQPRPQTLLFHAPIAPNHTGQNAITPATDLLAFADTGLPPLLGLNANRCFGQQLVGGAN